MVIEMVGGPFQGLVHEVAPDVAIPSSIGLLRDGMRHWYNVNIDDCVAIYSHCEADIGPQRGPSSLSKIKAESAAMMRELNWRICSRCHMSRPPNLMYDGQGECKMCLKRS